MGRLLKEKIQRAAADKKWRQANPEKVREIRRREYWKNRDKILAQQKVNWRIKRAPRLLSTIRKKCNRDGLSCDLTVKWLQERFDAGVCEMSGLPFDFATAHGPYCPSIDRIKAGGGYTQDNCRMIILFLNRALSNMGDDFACKVFAAVLERRARQ